MRKTVVNRFRDFVDFNVIQFGHEDCRPNYSIGNFVRSNHLIHFVHRGCGVYFSGGKEYALSASDAFLIYPKDVTYYRADMTDPWEYSWVEFSGASVESYLSSTPFSKESPVVFGCNGAEKPFLRLSQSEDADPYALYSRLLEVLSAFVSGKPRPASTSDEYVKYAVNYIHTLHYHGNITVSSVSDYLGINRSYLCRLFKEKLGISPKQYITEFKMKTAARLLEETSLTIGQVARSAGFEDQLYFATAFKAFYSHTPSEHREISKSNQEDIK